MEKRKPVTKAHITAAYVALVYARRFGDPLKIELAETALNDLLEHYKAHTYHTSHQES